MVNLMVISTDGEPEGIIKVRLLQDDDEVPARGPYCTWMPYQKGQAAKVEAMEKAAKVEAMTKINPDPLCSG